MEILKRILLDRFWERWLYFSLKLYPVVSSQEGFRPWNFSHLSMNFGLFQKAAGHLLLCFLLSGFLFELCTMRSLNGLTGNWPGGLLL